ncbi:MAG: LysM peptidoglycan-binding domain-containing protein [Tannerella sp.]|jgi:nucleoid-associated protein YgaU|nr:LysM peptidoglycan-binding domain-containing protein [Tannerella sp.]
MSLQEKYGKLVTRAQEAQVQDLSVIENEEVLYVSGKTSAAVKEELWSIYESIDPEFRAGDLVLDIEIIEGQEEIYEVQKGDNLTKIGKKYGLTWQQVFEANKDKIKDPNLIFPGQKLIIPV